jgi:DNA-binding LacI/PurR family transcriptional regulator
MAFRDPFALSVLDGLAEVLDDLGRTMLLVAQAPADPARAVDQLATQAVEAVVFPLCGMRDNPLVEHLAARGVPMVGSGAPVDPRVHHVRTDEASAMALTARHVVSLGHTRVAHLAMHLSPGATLRRVGPEDVGSAAYPDAAGRLQGFLDVVGPQAVAVQAPELSVGAGERAARLLLDVPAGRRPTAVVAQADLLAAGAVRAAESLGLRVPEDVSVTGFDGVDLPWLDHTLTTVLQPGAEKGRALGRLVRGALAGAPVADEPFPVSLRVGTTTAPLPPG